ncbi:MULTISPECIES: transketolase [Clostridium]|uniref:transketolase n=1 Tax=Clostridium TaxID=1485 RepID=UPI002108507F|nr:MULTISPECIES: transketolase [Clostridium]MBS4840277.1 transketolase [Clostridium sp.]MCQ2018559.1 transketolase [Clostridium butyricum]MDU1401665.1 transketolase [Clostridium sp.]MDU1601453.1 transketolase [Clostridium sp.]MDU2894618.1 transketolase [Clostridium sp.]
MINMNDYENKYIELAKKIRLDVLKMTYEKKAGFIGTSFSCTDILAVLYGGFVKIGNDTVILSKGHGASAWYATLANVGAIDREKLFTEFNTSGFKMGVHPKRNSHNGIESSSGSLGQGCGLACGYALGNKIQDKLGKVYAILGDGECNEGSVWESFMLAKRQKLNNLTVIIDRNCLQSYSNDENVLNMGDMEEKLIAFGFNAITVDGHNVMELHNALEKAQNSDMPFAIIANTIKGKGFPEFEDKVLWHYKWPEDEHYYKAIKFINGEEN